MSAPGRTAPRRLKEYTDEIRFLKELGKKKSEGAEAYQNMTVSEIIEDIE